MNDLSERFLEDTFYKSTTLFVLLIDTFVCTVYRQIQFKFHTFGETPKLENTSYEKSSCKIINNLIVLKTDQLAFASFYERLRSSVLLFVQFRFKTVRATYMELKMIGCTIEPHSIWCIQKCLLIWIIFYFSLSSRSVHLKRGRAILRVTFSRIR